MQTTSGTPTTISCAVISSAVLASAPELAPCPFCGADDISTSDCDDDSFVKTLVATCNGCGCTKQSSLDWRPYSATRDYAGFEAAWKAKIAQVWNTRAVPKPATSSHASDWVDCPVCGESDMHKTTDEDGNSLIHCVNHNCLSNGGTTQSRLDERQGRARA